LGVARLSLVFIFALVLVFSLAVFFEPAEAKKSAGTPLTEIGSAKVCGDKLCAAPQSIEEKIAAFLESKEIREGGAEQQIGRFSEGGVSQQAFDFTIPQENTRAEFILDLYSAQKWNQASFELFSKIKNAEVEILDERTDELWDNFDDSEDLEDLNMANSFEIASRQAQADEKQMEFVLQKLNFLIDKIQNFAKNNNVTRVELGESIIDQQDELEKIADSRIKNLNTEYRNAQEYQENAVSDMRKIIGNWDEDFRFLPINEILYGHIIFANKTGLFFNELENKTETEVSIIDLRAIDVLSPSVEGEFSSGLWSGNMTVFFVSPSDQANFENYTKIDFSNMKSDTMNDDDLFFTMDLFSKFA